jgi:hypothetical protein
MLSKENLIRTLKDSVDMEDEGVNLIITILEKRIEKSSLREEKRQRLMEITNTIKKETEAHKQAIIEMIEKVKGREQDDF